MFKKHTRVLIGVEIVKDRENQVARRYYAKVQKVKILCK